MKKIKERMKRGICRLFGHRNYEEVFAERTIRFLPNKCLPIYNVVRELRCDRCGKIYREVLRSGLHRAQLLKEGWFIEQ